jgi:hypothetical protein
LEAVEGRISRSRIALHILPGVQDADDGQMVPVIAGIDPM